MSELFFGVQNVRRGDELDKFFDYSCVDINLSYTVLYRVVSISYYIVLYRVISCYIVLYRDISDMRDKRDR